MGNWRKLLQQMAADPDPRRYTYDDAARILDHLGFSEPSGASGSHRRWRLKREGCNSVVIGLVDKGHGTLKPGYIRDLVKALQENGLMPDRREDTNE